MAAPTGSGSAIREKKDQDFFEPKPAYSKRSGPAGGVRA